MQRERLYWLDAAKGLAIGCVVLGHMSIPNQIGKFIFAFHMPFFFLIAGFLQQQLDFRKVFISRFNGLIGPYVLYGIPSIFIAIADRFEPGYVIRNFIIGNGVYTTWFLSALFCTSLFGCVLSRLFKSVVIKILIAFIVVLIGQNVAFLQHPHLLCIHTWVPAIFFWLIGNCVAQCDFIGWFRRQKFPWRLMTIVSLLLLGSIYHFNIRVSIAEAKLGCASLFYPSAVALSLLLIIACSSIPIRLKVLEFLGRNSLGVMVLHVLVPVVISIVVAALGGEVIGGGIIKWGLRLINLIVLVATVIFIDRRVPALAGRKKWIS